MTRSAVLPGLSLICLLAIWSCATSGDAVGDVPDAGNDVDASTSADARTDARLSPGDQRDGAVDAGTDAMLPAAAACTTPSSCGGPVVSTTSLSYRKDRSLPTSDYAEQGSDPTAGGRFHVAATAAVSGDVTSVLIGGVAAETLLGQSPKLEWYHVWPSKVTAGQPVWIAFHSQDPAWDAAGAQLSVVVQTSAGNAVNATLPVTKPALPITYVTTADAGATLVIHVRNDDAVPHTLSRLLAMGQDVSLSSCIPSPTVAPGDAVMWTVPLCQKAIPGGAWTVSAEWKDAQPSVAVGRVLPERFVVESWVTMDDCAFPGANAATYAAHQAAGFDTHYMYWGTYPACGFKGLDIIDVRAPAQPDFNVLLGDDFPAQAGLFKDPSRVTGFLIGDEVDDAVRTNGHSKPGDQATKTNKLWSTYPGIPVYQGAKTNKNVGAFAGATDVQGADFYAASCAPHITAFGTHPPLRGPFDYLRNTRNNHMPLPTWLYAQGLSDGWDKKQPVTGLRIRIQQEPAEVLVQGMSALAAGGKGLMWFQSAQDEAAALPDTWSAMSQMNWATRSVRALLREGDPTGLATTNGSAIVEAIRSRDGIVIPVVSLATSTAPTDTACAQAQAGLGAVPHWKMASQSLDVVVRVPDDFAVQDVFEISLGAGAVVAPASAPTFSGRSVTFAGLPFDQTTPVRLLVLARTSALRASVASGLHR
jgi:hypothetical protein